MFKKFSKFTNALFLAFVVVFMVLFAWELFSIGSGGYVPFPRETSWYSVGNSFAIIAFCIFYLEKYA